MLMNIHHRLRGGIINDRRYKIRFLEQLFFPVTSVLACRHGSFIFVIFLVVFLMQPVIILINRLIDKTEGRSLSEPGTSDQHHIKGWASFPLALYADMTRIAYCSSNSRKNNRHSIFHIEIFVSGKIEDNLLYLVREGIQRKTCFRNAFHFRTKHVGQMNGVKHSHLLAVLEVHHQ